MSEPNSIVGIILSPEVSPIAHGWTTRLQQESGFDMVIVNTVNEVDSAFVIIDFTGRIDSNTTPVPVIRPSFIDAKGFHAEALILNAHQQGHDTFSIAVLAVQQQGHVYAEGRFRLLNYAKEKNLQLCLEGMYQLLFDSCKKIANQLPSFPAKLECTSHVAKGGSIPGYRMHQFRHLLHVLFYRDCWNCGIIDAPPEIVAFEGLGKHPVTWMDEALGSDFKADPFGIQDADTNLLLYEYYRASDRKGILEVFANQTIRANIVSEVHLSYPYLFKHEGEIYCLPEQSRAGKLELWKMDNTGQPTEKVVLLHNFAAVDASIVYHASKWWIFCTNATGKGADLRLHIFYSDTLTGPWLPHALNPVKTDIVGARPGGSFFVRNGHLHRPAQDSSKGYGGALIIYKIDTLTTENFAETAVARVTPDPEHSLYGTGLHTLSAYGSQTLIDGKRTKFRPFHFLTGK